MARRFHLFPFRTEKLSFATPMVLRTSGRVGSRRFTESLEIEISRGFFCARKGTGNGRPRTCIPVYGLPVAEATSGVFRNVYFSGRCQSCRRALQKQSFADGRKLRDLFLLYPASKAYIISDTILKPSRQSFDVFKDWYGMYRNLAPEGK